MKICLALALASSACAFQVHVPVLAPAMPATSQAMTMKLGGGSGKGFGSRASSTSSRITNFLKKGGIFGGNNNNIGGGNNGPPPSSLYSSAAGDDGKKSSNPLVALWAAYNALLDSKPLLTKGLTSFLGFGLGDFLAQKFIDKADEINWERLARLALFGLLIHGPTGHYFYGFLDSKIPGTAALTVASKVGIDQLLWNPIFGVMFFGYMGVCEGLKLDEITDRIKNNLWTSVRGSWTVWPIAHAINFRFIPTSQRLLYINTIQIFYNVFLSVIAQNASEKA
ncbi:unnamed protein product [Chrysoparadoxa australica]